jgi:hypothetical protein
MRELFEFILISALGDLNEGRIGPFFIVSLRLKIVYREFSLQIQRSQFYIIQRELNYLVF